MDEDKVTELRKKRTFKKFTFRGIELDALLDLTNDELMDLVTCRARRRRRSPSLHRSSSS